MSSHFNPGQLNPGYGSEVPNRLKYEGVKAAFSADLLTAEKCFLKCPINLDSRDMSDDEVACLRQCHTKFFDSSLLIDSEMAHYVRGVPM